MFSVLGFSYQQCSLLLCTSSAINLFVQQPYESYDGLFASYKPFAIRIKWFGQFSTAQPGCAAAAVYRIVDYHCCPSSNGFCTNSGDGDEFGLEGIQMFSTSSLVTSCSIQQLTLISFPEPSLNFTVNYGAEYQVCDTTFAFISFAIKQDGWDYFFNFLPDLVHHWGVEKSGIFVAELNPGPSQTVGNPKKMMAYLYEILGDNHPDTLRAMGNLATTYSDLGEYQHAKDLEITVLEKRKQILGDNHPLTLRAMGNLAATCSDLGEYQNAKDLEVAVLEKRKEILEYQNAKDLEVTVLEKQKQILGDNHPDTLRAMGNLAATCSDLGEYQNAKDLEVAVLEKRKEILGDNHPDTLRAMGNLATTYSDLGECQHAKDLEITILGDNHPLTLLAMGNLARTYSALGEHQHAKDLEVTVLEKRKQILGENHPGTLLAMGNLARTYSDLGEHQHAKDLEVTVLEKRKQILGDNHPHTLTAMANLANTYSALGEYQSAKDFRITVMEKRKQILGDNHPDTLHAVNQALPYSNLAEHQKAYELEDFAKHILSKSVWRKVVKVTKFGMFMKRQQIKDTAKRNPPQMTKSSTNL
ncbi:hypothetical protein C8R45DRAFT_1164318 [Mycena sanguinolenta]|nr:hypothetical protein C8R45DRAFT_1164318 [Mycena sanguinolenta]